MYFREFTGHASYYRSLLAHLGLDTPAFKLKVAQAGLLNAPRALANRINGAMKRMTQFGAAPDVCDSIYKLE
jgi:hypothetical protein